LVRRDNANRSCEAYVNGDILIRPYSEIRSGLIIAMVFTSSLLFFLIGTRAIIAYSALIVLAILLINRQIVSEYVQHKSILLSLLFSTVVLTNFLSYYHHNEFSFYQLVRSQIWFLLGPYLLFIGHQLYVNSSDIEIERVIDAVGLLISLLAILVILDLTFQTNLIPAYIKLIDQVTGYPRYYLLGLEAAITFLPVFLLCDKKFYLCMAFLLVLFTGGRTIFAIVLAVYFLFRYFDCRKLTVFSLTALLLLAVSFDILNYKKIHLNYILTDKRVSSGSTILSAAQTNAELFFGIGLGTAYQSKNPASEEAKSIFYELSNPSENYRFDIENGFIFLIKRLGLIGTLTYIFLLGFRYGRYSKFLWSTLSILWLSMSPVGPSSCLFFFFFGISAAIYNKIFNKLTPNRL